MNVDLATETRAPDLVQALIGFRQWRVYDGRLHSLWTTDIWEGGRLDAGCRKSGRDPGCAHHAPDPSCSCGVHAYYRPMPRTAAAGWAGVVNGAVALWGSVEAHPLGMRATAGRVVALVRPAVRGYKRRMVEQISHELGVEMVAARSLVNVALRHGALLPDDLKPASRPIGVVRYFD